MHKLLARQLRKAARSTGDIDMVALIGLVSATYKEFDRERHMKAILDTVGEGVVTADRGIGIPQMDSSTTRRFGGSGLSLAISKRAVEGRQGVAVLVVADGDANTVPARPRAGRILLAEDNAITRDAAVGLLNALGQQVDTAKDGREALALIERGEYDLVLMDVQMPYMDGICTTRAIRALPGTKAAIPIIAMSASPMTGNRERCLAAGMNDYLSKPIDRTRLAAALQRIAAEQTVAAIGAPVKAGA